MSNIPAVKKLVRPGPFAGASKSQNRPTVAACRCRAPDQRVARARPPASMPAAIHNQPKGPKPAERFADHRSVIKISITGDGCARGDGFRFSLGLMPRLGIKRQKIGSFLMDSIRDAYYKGLILLGYVARTQTARDPFSLPSHFRDMALINSAGGNLRGAKKSPRHAGQSHLTLRKERRGRAAGTVRSQAEPGTEIFLCYL